MYFVAFRTNKIHAKQTNPKLRGKESVSCNNSDKLLLVSLPQQHGEHRDNSLRTWGVAQHKDNVTRALKPVGGPT